MRVNVIGAGIGGLALAQALHRAGIDVVVHDKDSHVAATGGYGLALDTPACAALRRHLSPEHYQALLGSSAPPEASRRFTLADHRLRALSVISFDPTEGALLIGRVPLRKLLAERLGDRVRFAVAYTGHEVREDVRVVAHFDDGSIDVADVLVGADGSGSPVAAGLADRPTSAPCGYGSVAVRIPLDATTRRRLPAVLDGGPPRDRALRDQHVPHAHDPGSGAAVDPATCREVAAVTEAPALIWGFIGPDSLMPPTRPAPLTVPGSSTSPSLRCASGPSTCGRSSPTPTPRPRPISASPSDPDAELTPWPAGPVTALGDAINAMPPTGGGSAATAIRDADHLAAELVAARDGTSTIPLATLHFHKTMAGFAPDRVRVSLGLLRSTKRLAHPSRAGWPGSACRPRHARPARGARGRPPCCDESPGRPASPPKCAMLTSAPPGPAPPVGALTRWGPGRDVPRPRRPHYAIRRRRR